MVKYWMTFMCSMVSISPNPSELKLYRDSSAPVEMAKTLVSSSSVIDEGLKVEGYGNKLIHRCLRELLCQLMRTGR